METLVERCAGLDVHTDSVTACVRVPNGHGGRQVETRRFTTTTAGLGLLAQWLASYRVTRVPMESTGCYWKPVWQLLEDQLECWLLNAAHLHNVPGRKTDVADAAWIAQLVEHGLVRPSFEAAPPDPGAARARPATPRPRPESAAGRPRRPGQGAAGRWDPSCRVWPPTASGPLAGRCWQPWWPAPMTRRCWPHWPRVRLRTKLPALREALAGSGPTITGCWSPRSWPTSTTWTRPSRCCRRGSSR